MGSSRIPQPGAVFDSPVIQLSHHWGEPSRISRLQMTAGSAHSYNFTEKPKLGLPRKVLLNS